MLEVLAPSGFSMFGCVCVSIYNKNKEISDKVIVVFFLLKNTHWYDFTCHLTDLHISIDSSCPAFLCYLCLTLAKQPRAQRS